MKKILFIVLSLLINISCATTKTISTEYDHITLEKAHNALAGCDDTNGGRWWMNIGGMQVAVLQLSNCLGVEDILVMITDTDNFTSEIRHYSYKVLGLHFLEHINVARPGQVWTLEQIREFDVAASEEEPGKWFVIYKINTAPLPLEN
tara:strand:- start:139 stop:582 length:444 start_codon:yes stop_codon:yes gene_type:complete